MTCRGQASSPGQIPTGLGVALLHVVLPCPHVHARELRVRLPRLGADEVLHVLKHLAGVPLADGVFSPEAYRRALPFAMTCREYYTLFTEAIRGVALLPVRFGVSDRSTIVLGSAKMNGREGRCEQGRLAERKSSRRNSRTRAGRVTDDSARVSSPQQVLKSSKSISRAAFPSAFSRRVSNAMLRDMTAMLPSLVHMEVSFTVALSDDGVRAVARACPHLRLFKVSGNHALTKESILALRGCRELETLDLSFCKGFRDDAGPLLSGFQELRNLSISYWRISDMFLGSLFAHGGAKALETISLGNCVDVSDVGISYIARYAGERLLGLRIRGCARISDRGLSMLAATAPRLEHIDASYNENIIADGVGSLGACETLRYVDLTNCSALTDGAVANAVRGGGIEEVHLSWCTLLTDAAIGSLTSCPNLTRIGLDGCSRLTDLGVRSLAECRELAHLSITYCPGLTDETLTALVDGIFISLKDADVRFCQGMTADSVERVRRAPAHPGGTTVIIV
jgi:hypothetical protein